MKIEMAAEILHAMRSTISDDVEPKYIHRTLRYDSVERLQEECKRKSWLDLL